MCKINYTPGRNLTWMTLISVAITVPFLFYARSIDKSLKVLAEGTYEEYKGEIEEEEK